MTWVFFIIYSTHRKMGGFGMGHSQEPRPLMPKRPDSRHLRRSGQRASKLIPIILGPETTQSEFFYLPWQSLIAFWHVLR
jgi:hypothetical protein